MKIKSFLLLMCLLVTGFVLADEKMLYSDDFQGWDKISNPTSEVSVTKVTNFSKENLTFKLLKVSADPTKYDASRFNYNLVSTGALMAEKMATAEDVSYIETSPLASITKIWMVVGATGSNRGYKVWKKADGDADWVAIHTAVANPANGDSTTIAIPGSQTNVALKFTNLAYSQNAYLFDLKIYGLYESTAEQVTLTSSVNIPEAGSVRIDPVSDTYDINSVVSLTANRNFGYQFLKWVDEQGATISTENPLELTLSSNKTVEAVFEQIPTFSYQVSIEGSQWGEVSLNPLPVEGKYEGGTTVSMTVVPNAVTNFIHWEDQSTELSRTIVVNADQSFTATFDEVPFVVGWNFKAQEPRTGRAGDFYSQTDNMGSISMYEPTGTPVNWLANGGSFNPSYPCVRIWTLGSNFETTRRYFEASFSTLGYENVQVKSMVSGNYRCYSVHQLQYSLDGTEFTTLNSADITSVYNSGWVDLNSMLPVDAEGKAKVYIRWIADTSSPILGNAGDNDGMALTNIYVYADQVAVNDTIAPQLLATVPAEGAEGASAKGSITLTFDERMKAGTGDCVLDGEVLTPSFGSKSVTFSYSKLDYNTQYSFVVPAGALTDMSDNAFAGVTLTFRTMNRPQPTPKVFDFVVATDGSGDGTTIQSAFNAVPVNNTQPFLILVKNGTYAEYPTLPATKPHVHLIGQDRDGVIITGQRFSGLTENGVTYSTSTCQTMEIMASNFYGENFTVKNTAGVGAGQAVALKSYGDRNIFRRVKLTGYQDTHLTGNGRQLYLECDIHGTVDFIFGGGDVFFDRCLIYMEGRPNGDVIVAPSTSASNQWGYVFNHCTIDGDAATQHNNYLLGRPWQNAPRAVFLHTRMNILPAAAGWTNMGVIPALFAEYNSMSAAGTAVDLSNRKNSFTTSGGETVGDLQTVLTDAQAAQYTLSNVLKGTDEWVPGTKTELTEAPVGLRVENKIAKWDATPYAISYVIAIDDKIVGMTTSTSFDISSLSGLTVTVFAVAESGALSEAASTTLITDGLPRVGEGAAYGFIANGQIVIKALTPDSQLEVFDFNGRLLQSTVSAGTEWQSALLERNAIVRIVSEERTQVIKVGSH